MYERPMRQLFLLLPLAGVALAGLPACGPLPDDEEAEVLDGEIVGGSPARADDARFMAAFFGDKILFDGSRESGHFCGGTFIAPDLVLTASHCVVETPAYLMSVGNRKRRLSDHLVEQRFVAGPDGAAVAAYWLHPGYDGSVLDNDVALVKLARPLRPRVLPFLDGPEQERRLAAPGTSSTVVDRKSVV